MCVEGAEEEAVIGVCGSGGGRKARRRCYRCVWRGQEEGVIGVCVEGARRRC